MPSGRPLLFTDVDDLSHKIGDYFASCWDYKRDMFGNRVIDKDLLKEDPESKGYVMHQIRPYTVGGLAVALNCSRDTLCEYGKGEGDRAEFSDTIKAAKDKIEQYAEESLYIGKNQAGAIFVMKNCYGWNDKTEIDWTGKIVEMPTIKRDGVELKFDIGSGATDPTEEENDGP